MPESRWITHSVRNPKPSLPTVTWPENPPSKYFAVASAIRSLMRERNASPTSIFLPETRNDICWPPISITLHGCGTCTYADDPYARLRASAPQRPCHWYIGSSPTACQTAAPRSRRSEARTRRGLLLAPPLHRGWYPHRLSIFGDGAAGGLDSRAAPALHQWCVGGSGGRALRLRGCA